MGDSVQRRRRWAAKAGNDNGDGRPSDLRQALADLGRVIGEPFPEGGRAAQAELQP